MYTVFSQICMVNKIRSFFSFFQKINTTQFFFFNIYLGKNNSLTRVKIHVSNWTRVFNTRVHLDTSIKYTRPIVKMVQLATCLIRHVSNWTRVYSNRYCRHASNCVIFCSDGLEFKGFSFSLRFGASPLLLLSRSILILP
jgi:hypothetical protein